MTATGKPRGGKRSGRSRWGDEACIVLVDAEKSRAVERAERLRASITNADFRGLHVQVCGSTTRGTTRRLRNGSEYSSRAGLRRVADGRGAPVPASGYGPSTLRSRKCCTPAKSLPPRFRCCSRRDDAAFCTLKARVWSVSVAITSCTSSSSRRRPTESRSNGPMTAAEQLTPAVAQDQSHARTDARALREIVQRRLRRSSDRTGLTLAQPVTGFQVESVHSIAEPLLNVALRRRHAMLQPTGRALKAMLFSVVVTRSVPYLHCA